MYDQEPNFTNLANPARVLVAQKKFVAMPTECRYRAMPCLLPSLCMRAWCPTYLRRVQNVCVCVGRRSCVCVCVCVCEPEWDTLLWVQI